MKRTFRIFCSIAAVALAAVLGQGCSKAPGSNSTNNSSVVALTIQTGAQTLAPGGTQQYSAVLLDKNGNTTIMSPISWSVSGAGGSSIGTFSGTTFTAGGVGYGTVTATATVGGQTFTASVPVGVYTAGIFAVVPSAVVWSTNAGSIQLHPVYLGMGATGYSYHSGDASVASVDGSGNITFNKAGECLITVTASNLPGSPAVAVPVLVVGSLPAALPNIMAGLRISAGLSVIGAIIGEFIIGSGNNQGGMGVQIIFAQGRMFTALLFAEVIAATLLGFLFFSIVSFISTLLLRSWHESASR